MQPKEEKEDSQHTWASAIKSLIAQGRNGVADSFIGMSTIRQHDPELMQAAIYYGNIGIIEKLLSCGASLEKYPEIINGNPKTDPWVVDYWPAPYTIQGARRGDMYGLLPYTYWQANSRLLEE